MIARLTGVVEAIEPGGLVLGLGAVSIRVLAPATSIARLALGSRATLLTHLAVRQDHVALYGFEDEDALHLFELLLSVAGVGPKGALALLSTLAADALRTAIIDGDSRALSRAPGIGARVASRICAELQQKLAALPVALTRGDGVPHASAMEALIGLGYSVVDARRAIAAAPAESTPEDLIRHALAFLDDRSR